MGSAILQGSRRQQQPRRGGQHAGPRARATSPSTAVDASSEHCLSLVGLLVRRRGHRGRRMAAHPVAGSGGRRHRAPAAHPAAPPPRLDRASSRRDGAVCSGTHSGAWSGWPTPGRRERERRIESASGKLADELQRARLLADTLAYRAVQLGRSLPGRRVCRGGAAGSATPGSRPARGLRARWRAAGLGRAIPAAADPSGDSVDVRLTPYYAVLEVRRHAADGPGGDRCGPPGRGSRSAGSGSRTRGAVPGADRGGTLDHRAPGGAQQSGRVRLRAAHHRRHPGAVQRPVRSSGAGRSDRAGAGVGFPAGGVGIARRAGDGDLAGARRRWRGWRWRCFHWVSRSGRRWARLLGLPAALRSRGVQEPVLGPVSSAAGPLALVGLVIVLIGALLWERAPSRRWPGVLVALLLLAGAPYLLAELGPRDHSPVLRRVDELWLAWHLTLFLFSRRCDRVWPPRCFGAGGCRGEGWWPPLARRGARAGRGGDRDGGVERAIRLARLVHPALAAAAACWSPGPPTGAPPSSASRSWRGAPAALLAWGAEIEGRLGRRGPTWPRWANPRPRRRGGAPRVRADVRAAPRRAPPPSCTPCGGRPRCSGRPARRARGLAARRHARWSSSSSTSSISPVIWWRRGCAALPRPIRSGCIASCPGARYSYLLLVRRDDFTVVSVALGPRSALVPPSRLGRLLGRRYAPFAALPAHPLARAIDRAATSGTWRSGAGGVAGTGGAYRLHRRGFPATSPGRCSWDRRLRSRCGARW